MAASTLPFLLRSTLPKTRFLSSAKFAHIFQVKGRCTLNPTRDIAKLLCNKQALICLFLPLSFILSDSSDPATAQRRLDIWQFAFNSKVATKSASSRPSPTSTVWWPLGAPPTSTGTRFLLTWSLSPHNYLNILCSVFEGELSDAIPVVYASIADCRIIGRLCVGKTSLPTTLSPPHALLCPSNR